jgi:ATP-dependent helicase/nuclease subunit A
MTMLHAHDDRAEVVTAPAGSGKTTLLVRHFLRHLRDGIPVERIVAITFTRKAAAELVERVAGVLAIVASGKAAHDKKLTRLYEDALPTLEQARAALTALDAAPVTTVDAFCLSLVQEFILDACFVLDDGSRVYVDGPVESAADSAPYFEAAAREELEKLSKYAKVLLAEINLAAAIAAVAKLASTGPFEARTLADLLAAVGKALAPLVKRQPDEWLGAARSVPEVRDWLACPKGPVPVAALKLLAYKAAAKLGGDDVVAAALSALGWQAQAGLPSSCLGAWRADEAGERADAVRAALVELGKRARRSALREIARAGALGYAEMLAVATALCESPPSGLADRYDVLLVDELQDTNPAQLAFYRAFAGMRAGRRRIRRFFVGDTRQSIFRFRHADPQGWQALVDEAHQSGTHGELTVNYRSSKRLVDVQRELFGRLATMFPGALDPLDRVEPDPDAPAGDDEIPVQIVDGVELKSCDEHVLALFARRLRSRWARPATASETAAVLVRSWKTAAAAVESLHAHGIAAQLTGDPALLASRPAADLRLLLSLLVDPSDELTAAAVIKHPALGVTDRGLLLARQAGLLGRLLVPDLDLSALGDESPNLAEALAVLRRARARIGREPTAGVLERLVAELHLRPIVSAGPEGQYSGDVGLAQLDVLLDVVREHERNGVDPQSVLDALAPAQDEGAGELPVVRMHATRQVVTVTTVFGAKGLAFDHVALLGVERPGSDGREDGGAFTVYHPRGKPMLAVRIDPNGGIEPIVDPFAALARAASGDQAVKEGMRLFYVGFTRARRSVVFGIPKSNKDKSNTAATLRQLLDQGAITGVERMAPNDIALPDQTPLVRARTGQLRPFVATWAEPQGWILARPSSAAELGVLADQVVADFKARARVVVAPPGPSLPTGKELQDVPEITWGSVVHGWLERWAFEGTPDADQAADYLRSEWSSDDKSVAAWLVALGLHLRDQLPGFRDLLARATELHFEWPMVGVDETTIWRGRSDLVIELPGRKGVIIDFKAGSRFARSPGDIPNVEEHAPQLEAYRRMLEAGGYEVTEVGLLYVRRPSWVRVV